MAAITAPKRTYLRDCVDITAIHPRDVSRILRLAAPRHVILEEERFWPRGAVAGESQCRAAGISPSYYYSGDVGRLRRPTRRKSPAWPGTSPARVIRLCRHDASTARRRVPGLFLRQT